jgi:hypothetical protein
MKLPLAAAIAATAVAAGLPASASADPPITPPEGSTCTFEKGITTCVEPLFGFGSVLVEEIDVDPAICPSGRAEHRITTRTIVKRVTVFRGMHQQGDPREESETSRSETTTCLPAPDPG